MRLKKLLVKGFKSFADKTEFDFDAPLTGIVGPNGCGKSNVVDALKWVLGDQRPKSLRGASMTDVIFKGAEGREGMHAAEVIVELEEGEAGSDAGGRQVSIGRRLTRDAESTYLLDGEAVRLKDVRGALMDTGLGVHAYAVMEQGRIDAVLSANPEDRRAIFEEAAGISKFKVQKKETLRRLERTEQNLARVTDLLQERERRIRSLKAQAGRARRYVELREELRQLQTALGVCEAGRLETRASSVDEEIQAGDGRLAELAERRAELDQRLAEVDGKIGAAEKRVAALQDELAVIQSQRDAANHRVESLVERAEALREDAVEADERRETAAEERAGREGELADARSVMEAAEARRIELAKSSEALQNQAKSAQHRVRVLQQEREVLRGQVLEFVHARTRCRNLAHEAESHARQVAARVERLEQRIRELAVEDRDAAVQLALIDVDLDGLRVDLEHSRGRQEMAVRATAKIDADAGSLAQQESELNHRLVAVRTRLETLRSMEEEREGVDTGPRRLLERKPEGLRGRLIDMVEVDLEISRALEAALGPYVQALVVETRAQAESMLRQLVEDDGGRALLLVREEFDPAFEECCCMQKLPAGAELLANRIDMHPDVRPILYWILRGVALVEGLETSHRNYPDVCFVTREGLLSCGPRIEGGRSEAMSGLVVRRAQIQDLDEQAAVLVRDCEALRVQITSTTARSERLRARASKVGESARRVEARIQEVTGERTRVSAALEQHERERSTHVRERADLGTQRAGAVADLGHHLFSDFLLHQQEEDVQAEDRECGAELDAAREEAEVAVAAEHEVRVEQTATAAERDAADDKAQMHERALDALDRSLVDLSERAETAREGAEDADARCEEARAEAAAKAEEFGAKQRERDASQAELVEVRAGRDAEQGEVRTLDAERTELQQQVSDAKVRRAELEHKRARLDERLRDDVGLGLGWWLGEQDHLGITVREPFGPRPLPDTVLELAGPALPPQVVATAYEMPRLWLDPEFDEPEAGKRGKSVRAELDRLGNVNVDAVRELEEEEENLGTLQIDHEDLQQSRKQLYEALKTMERESRDLFEKTFEQARDNFRHIFRKLFQGGRADMYLTEAESGDALEAGIDIVAKPPGKELQSIGLLSGGERSMTALAILFAVFKVKPSPFCILDEVDAALDETNVERFLRVLRDFVGPTQFCVVTHHKRTMAECHSLYGITMQKRGVSTRIAVDLREVDQLGGPEQGPDPALKARIAGEEKVGFES